MAIFRTRIPKPNEEGFITIPGHSVGFQMLNPKPLSPNQVSGNLWFVLLWMPIFPIAAYLIQPLRENGNTLYFKLIHKERIDWYRVIETYLYGWIFLPLLLLGPIFFCIPEVQDSLGTPKPIQSIMIGAAILWFVFGIIKLSSWLNKRWFDTDLPLGR